MLASQRIVRLVLILMSVLASSVRAQTSPGTITVSGEAELMVTPNLAVIKATIESQAADVPAVRKANNEATQAILKFLKEQQLEDSQIQTGFIEIRSIKESSQVYNEKGKAGQQRAQANQQLPNSDDPFGSDDKNAANEQAARITFQATRELAITVLDFEKLEEIYCGLLTRRINGSPTVLLQTTDAKRHLGKVRQEAVQDAKDKAQLMAGQLNSQVVSIRSMTESQIGSGRSSMRSYDPFDGGSSSATTVAGKVTYAARVDIVFQLSEAVLRK